jgi:serine beta-lactamase-like protein LACTB, mitochondrial
MNTPTLFILYFVIGTSFALPQNWNKLLQNSRLVDSSGTFYQSEIDIQNAITKSQEDVERWRVEIGIPGVVAGISIKGKEVWTEAFGYSDIENNVKAHRDSVWRMASISKSLTTALVGKLIDEGKLDLDKSIHEYLSPNIFPIKQWNGKNVTITLKQVMSHTAGLRVSIFPDDFLHVYTRNNVTETLAQFKDEPLIHEPGTTYNYSNYGFQVVGAIIESVLNEPYESAITKMFHVDLGMTSTFPERREQIIPHRARYYMKNDYTNMQLRNAHIVDDLEIFELWWPCGGLLSTVPDLLQFGNIMLSSFKGGADGKPGKYT